MKRSSVVAPSIFAAVAALVSAGCAHNQTADCVDQYGHIQPDQACRTNYGYNSGYYHSHWVYGGDRVGAQIVGGANTPDENATVRTRTGTTISEGHGFGGFGESSHGGFGEGGHGGGGGE